MATIIAVLNRKGGVGKTTTAEVLAYYLHSVFGKRVLLVDCDSQANLTTGQGYDWQELEGVGKTLGHVLLGKARPQDAIQKSTGKAHLLPASDGLKRVEQELIKNDAPVTQLREVLEELRPLYDFILIDGPPAFSHITKSAMVAADVIVIPQKTLKRDVEGLDLFFEAYFDVRDEHNPHSKVLCVLPTDHDPGSRAQVDVLEYLPNLVPGDVQIFEPAHHSRFVERASLLGAVLGEIGHLSQPARVYKQLASQIVENYG